MVLVKSLFDQAKLLWLAALFTRIIATAIGLFFALTKTPGVYAPWALASVILCAEVLQWQSDLVKGRAEQLKRKIEFDDGLGWPISQADLSDVIAVLSKKQKKTIEQAVRENYFASERSVGAARLLDNLTESSWWSKHLSLTMARWCGSLVAILVLVSLLALGTAVNITQKPSELESTSRVVCAVLTLLMSAGLVKLFLGYQTFFRKSEQIEDKAKALSGLPSPVSESEVIKLMHDYQLARASAPLIPDMVWKSRRDGLNELWNVYRKDVS